jgi:hypothetical protein
MTSASGDASGQNRANPVVIRGVQNPEDFAVIPGTEWVVTAAKSGAIFEEARSFFVNLRTHEVRPAYPENCVFDLDHERFGEISPPEAVHFHGLDVVRGADGVLTLYQVSHPLSSGPRKGAGRESVEIFEIVVGAEGPSLVWRGAVVAPSFVNGNEVCALPEGGFALTNFALGAMFSLVAAKGSSGHILEWRDRDSGWRIVEGTDVNAPNGAAISPDEAYYFIASWATQQVHRVSRENPHGDRVTIDTGILNDNITWTPDGRLLVAGPATSADYVFECMAKGTKPQASFRAIKFDPVTMETQILVEDQIPDFFATTAVQISEREVWVSGHPGDRLLVYELPASR